MCGCYHGVSLIFVSIHISAKVKTVIRLSFWFLLLRFELKSRNKTVPRISLLINSKLQKIKKHSPIFKRALYKKQHRHEPQNDIFIFSNAWHWCESVTLAFCWRRFCICFKSVWGFLVFQHRYKRISHTNSHARGQYFVFYLKIG